MSLNIYYTHAKRMFSVLYWHQPVCPSVHVLVFVSVYKIIVSVKELVGIKSHLVTAVVSFAVFRCCYIQMCGTLEYRNLMHLSYM